MKAFTIGMFILWAAVAAAQTHPGHGSASTPAKPGEGEHAGHGAARPQDSPATEPAPAAEIPEGYAEVELSSERQQLLSVKTATAERGVLTGSIRASAIIAVDEARETHVHSKLMGWVQDLFVNTVGQTVKKGDPLYSMYSQELFAAQQEYLRARTTMPDLAKAARTRLELWDVPADQVRLVEKGGPRKAIVFRSPISGTVIEKQILKGHAVDPEMMLYRIADLTQVWVLAEIYEYEASRLDPEGTASILVQGQRKPVTARIDYVYPTVDERTRTIRIRLVLPNPQGALRPGNFATVDLPARSSEAIWVPDAAIIDTGVRQIVYVVSGPGRFLPRQVRVGRRSEGKAEILAGIQAGAQVLVSSQFLIDSESRLRGATEGGAPQHGGH